MSKVTEMEGNGGGLWGDEKGVVEREGSKDDYSVMHMIASSPLRM